MALYCLITTGPAKVAFVNEKLKLGETLFGLKYQQVSNSVWFIRAEKTTTSELSESLFIDEEEKGEIAHIITSFDNYFGWHDNSLWEWLDAD